MVDFTDSQGEEEGMSLPEGISVSIWMRTQEMQLDRYGLLKICSWHNPLKSEPATLPKNLSNF